MHVSAKYKLFFQRDPYAVRSDGLFVDLVKENLRFQIAHCAEYATILQALGFDPEHLQTEADLCLIPPLPTLYFKRNQLLSVNESELSVKASSSGTKGFRSRIGLDRKSMAYGVMMMFRFFSRHKVLSAIPTNYIILGYELTATNDVGAAKTAYGTSKFAPALHREYALKYNGSNYEVNIEGVQAALARYSKQSFPVRLIGFPAYMYFLARELRNRNVALKLNARSKILLGGGWKQFADEEIDRDVFHALIEETLGIDRRNCLEFFSAVEHPLPYLKCENGHFHVPAYSRAIIRDVRSLSPIPYGTAGLLSFVSPLVSSMPLISVVTDDVAVMRPGEDCGCGIGTPYFDLLGRAGVTRIKTCATEAVDFAK
jgi:phenylacetate-coenzyme A ligase PaaK-like adenylate-forming protein